MSFTYRGTTSDSMFFNVTERQVYNAPAFDVNAIEVPGRSGDVLNSQQRFKNKTLVYTGFIRSSDFPGNTQWERLSRGLRNIKAWICGDAGKYHDLTDDYDPGFIRRAFVSGETAINILFDRPDGATITITFMAEPFMYEVSEPMELPETKSASGSIITITDGADNTPLKSAVVNIEPVQSGSGDPSPTNIRPISGWSEVNVWVKPTYDTSLTPTATISLGQTVYGGTLDVVTGKLTIDYHAYVYTGGENFGKSGTALNGFYNVLSKPAGTHPAGWPNMFDYYEVSALESEASSMFKMTRDANAYKQNYGLCYLDTGMNFNAPPDVFGTTVASFKAKLAELYAAGTPLTVVAKLATPIEVDLTPQTIKTLLGVNNIWANTGETEVEYIVPTENPTQWPSQPRLEITMSGAGTLTVNGKTWSIGSYTGTLICDSEIMDWYDAGALKNSLVSGDGFPELVPGDNVITYTGGITKVVATPRWRTL